MTPGIRAVARRSLPRLPRHVLPLPQGRDYLDRWTAVTVVRGIQGYGKTTLVAAWLRDQPETVRSLWVRARKSNDHPVTFSRPVGGEISRHRPLASGTDIRRSDDMFALLDQMLAA